MREIVFDTETTGLNATSGDRLVEIGCIELVDRKPTGKVFHAFFNPERSMPAEAFAVHGLSDEFLSDKPLFETQVSDLLAFLSDSTLVAHNASFDFGFLNAELARLGMSQLPVERMADTLALARALYPGAKHTLDALCERFEIDLTQRGHFGALLDSQLLAQVYVKLRAVERERLLTSEETKQLAVTLDEAAAALLRMRDLVLSSAAPSAYGKIGHNRPSEELLREHSAAIEQGAIAAAAASAELAKPEPRIDLLRLCHRMIKAALQLLKQIAKWTGGKLDTFADEAAKSTGKAVGPVVIAAAAGMLVKDLLPLMTQLAKLIE